MPKADLAPAVPAKNRHIGTGISLAVLAAVFTLCNCVKPLQVDDAAYVLYAAHIAEHPLAPYDFAVYWGHQFQPANQVLAPPVLLYWMAGAHAVFGDNPTLWKLSLLPWHVLLTISLFSLLRRWTGALSLPLTWMALLSPALLPSTNLMLDVPALALSLTAVALFVKAAERGGWRLAALAGLVAGLAMQTKYSAFVTPWVLLCYGLTHGRLRLALLAAATALCIFAAWELFVATVHGDSHFLLAAQQRGESLLARIRHMVIPTLTLTAALAPGVLFAAVLGWRRSGRWLAVAIMVAAGGFLLLGVVPPWLNEWFRNPVTGRSAVRVDGVLYGLWTTLWWGTLTLTIWRHWRSPPRLLGAPQRMTSGGDYPRRDKPGGSSNIGERGLAFLLIWLALEIVGCVALSPFPAARRVLGVTVAATILIGYLIARQQPSLRMAWTATVASMVLGFAVALIDIHEAQATESLATAAVQVAQRENLGGCTWFSGTWAFQYYAMHHGMVPIAPEISELRAGDLLILPEQQLNRIDFHTDQAPLAKLRVVTVEDNLPWQTLPCYYCGPTPLRHHEGPRLRLTVYRVLTDFAPRDHGSLPGVH